MGRSRPETSGGGRALSRAVVCLFLGVLAPLPSRAQVHLRLEAGWDGVARSGGVVPLRVTVRLPDDAPAFPPDRPWVLRVSPRGGPWNWRLVLPVGLAAGATRVVDAAIVLHGEDTALAVELVAPDGQSWARTSQVLALLPAHAELGVSVGTERGVRRVRDEHATPAEVTWIRLPAHQLPAEPAGWLDLSRLRWERGVAQPPAAAELGYRLWASWSAPGRADVAPEAASGRSAAPVGEGWQVAREQLDTPGRRPRGMRTAVLAVAALAALSTAAAVRPATWAARDSRRRRAAWAALALAASVWLAAGAPRGAGRVTPLASHSETIGDGVRRTWDLCQVDAGALGRPITWPRADQLLVAPAWLPRDELGWELWWWMPGAAQPRWEVRPSRRGAGSRWIGLSLATEAPAPSGGTIPSL